MSGFHALKICSVERITPHSVALTFDVPVPLREVFRFRAGQYVTLRMQVKGEECRRSYSICAGEGENLTVGVKRVEGGAFSQFINDELHAGAMLDVMPPQGRFTCPDGARRLVMLAAGSGITPMLSHLRTVLQKPDTHATLLYGNQTTASIMFREALEDLKDRYATRFAVFHVLSRESQDIPALNGRIDAAKIHLFLNHVAKPAETDCYFLCGPFGFVEEGARALRDAGVEEGRIKAELFSTAGVAPRRPPPVSAQPTSEALVHCCLDGVTTRIHVADDEHVVDAAHRQGLELPFSCKGGMCCTCRCKVVDGEVVMDANYSLEDWEIKAGYVLACQARPVTKNVTLDFDAA